MLNKKKNTIKYSSFFINLVFQEGLKWEVKNSKLKKQVAEEHGIPYHQVQQITKDIDIRYHIPNDVIKKIRRKVEGGIRESS